jgi:phage tail sheath protein FI
MPANFLHGVEVVELTQGVRPLQTVRSAVIGVIGTAPAADAATYPLNEPVLISGSRSKANLLGATGTLKGALEGIFAQVGATVVVVRVAEGADEAATIANIVGDSTAKTGVWAFLKAESVLGVSPKLLCAPGYTHQCTLTPGSEVANTVVAQLVSIASGGTGVGDRLRAVVIADGPNTTQADAQAYADLHVSDRLYVVDPWVKISASVTLPSSAFVAGVIAKSDAERGFWYSPSNRIIQGIVGTSRAIGFFLSDENSEANILNENDVATIVRENGFRLWGNHSTTADAQYQFISTRRIIDMVNESVMRAHLWAVDRCITRTYLQDVSESVAAYLRTLETRGAILGSRVYVDPDANTATDVGNGQVTIDFEITPTYPAERVRFRSILTNGFIQNILTDSAADDNSENQDGNQNNPDNQATADQSGSGTTTP